VTTPFYSSVDSIQVPTGTWIKPGGRVAAYVRSTGLQEGDDLFAMSGNLVASINEGCKRCRSGMNDIVYVLPGHTESLAVADAIPDLVAGTQIVSCGQPGSTNNPTLTWTATAASLLLNVANVGLHGLTLNFAGVDNVAAPLTISAAGCVVNGCNISTETASLGALKGIEITAGGSGAKVVSNTFLALGEAQPMTSAPVLISGAADNVLVADNYISAANPGTSVLGLIAVTAAATNLRILRNILIQLETAGTALFGVTVGDVAASGVIAYNLLKVGSDVTLTTAFASQVGTAGLVAVAQFENYACDATNTQGAIRPAASS